jgi:glycosyltransferase involved in cell wall biosynthesis
MYKVADAVVSLSNDTQKLLREIYHISEEKNYLIPNGLINHKESIDLPNKIRNTWYLTSQDKVLLFVGRTTKIKGLHVLLKSFRDVLKKYPKARLVIIGNVFNMTSFVKDYGPAVSQIIYTGLINKEELSSWYQIANLGIISSYSEQCSYTGIEMLAYGLPIVASDGWGVRNMFTEGENAHIAHLGNRKNNQSFQQSLTQAIIDVLDMDETQILRMRQNARWNFEKNYTFNQMKEKYRQLIEQI